MQKKYYPYLDLLKFICCIGIVGIHTWPLFYAVEPLKDWYEKLCPVFVSIFFVVSSMLFWQKMDFNNNDLDKLGHFCKRLLILLGCWSIIVLPHWLPKFIRHNPNDWYLWIVPKILTTGTEQGSWFIMALIYGTIICSELLQLKKDTPLTYVASERTAEYYKSRPCLNQVITCAKIFGEFLNEEFIK